MNRGLGAIAILLVLLAGFGLVNMVYAQGPNDGCAQHPMWHTEDCPFADSENWPEDMMGTDGCWMWEQMQAETSTTMPFGRRGMMGMGPMMHGNHVDTSTMPYMGMMYGMMGNCLGNTDTDFEWDGEIPEEPASAEIGDPENGAVLFAQNACIACHDTTHNVTYVGPSLIDVGNRAAEYDENMSAYSYLYQSIVDPNAHIVEGFVQSVMPSNFGNYLTKNQINDLIAYLLTLE